MSTREKRLLRIARYWKSRSLQELLRSGCVRMCNEHHVSIPYDPFRKPAERTAQRDEALRRKGLQP